MQIITQIRHGDLTINFMIQKNSVGYSFEHEGKSYGHKTALTTKKRDELVGVIAILTSNAISSYEALKNGKNTN